MTDNGQIIWEDPPPAGSGVGHWMNVLAPLVEHPGRWARVMTGRSAGQTAAHLRRGRYQIPPGRWEFTSRQLDDGHKAIYARYLGPDEP